MKTEDIKKTCKEAVSVFGSRSQVGMAKEECAELIVALEHFSRGRAMMEDVRTEIADVMITTAQLALIFGEDEVMDEVRRKITRLQKKIDKSKEAWRDSGLSRPIKECTEQVGSKILERYPELKSEDEKIRKGLIAYLKADMEHNPSQYPQFYDAAISYLEKQKDASKAIEAVDKIDRYIDEHVINAHDMKDSNPDKKYYRGWDDALGEMSGILLDVYSDEKQKEQKPEVKDPFDDEQFRRGYEAGKNNANREQVDALVDEYNKGFEAGKTTGYNYAMKEMEQKEQKPVDLVAELKHHLATTPKEQLEKEWKELEPWGNIGPTVEEFLHDKKPVEITPDDELMLERIMQLVECCNDKEMIWNWLCQKVKDGEQKPVDGKELLYVCNKSYNIGFRDGKMEAQKSAEKTPYNSEVCSADKVKSTTPMCWGRELEKKMYEATNRFFAPNTDPNRYSVSDLFYAGVYAERELNSQSEWSEEDENALGDLMWCIEQARKFAKDENDMGNIWFAERWLKDRLKSLRPQILEDWTSEDDELLANVLGCITLVQTYKACGDLREFQMGHTGEELRSFVRSLKSRPRTQLHWKPSEEQMEALERASKNEYLSAKQYDVLVSLYEQLKKL